MNLWIKMSLLANIAALMIALSNTFGPSFLVPGFTSLVLFHDNLFLVSAIIFLASAFSIWLLNSNSHTIGIYLSIAVALLFLNIWISKSPAGAFFPPDTLGYAAVDAQTLATGQVLKIGWGIYPGIFTFTTIILELTHLSMVSMLTLVGFISTAMLGAVLYLISKEFLAVPRYSTIAAIFAVIGDPELSKIPLFSVDSYGLIFFLVFVLCFIRFTRRGRKADAVAMVTLGMVSVVTYPLSPVVILMVLGLFLITNKGGSNGTYSSIWRLFLGLLTAFVVWLLYYSFYLSFPLSVVTTISNLISGGTVAAGGSAGSGSIFFYAESLLRANTTYLPFGLGYLTLFWLGALYLAGISAWLLGQLFQKGTPRIGFLFVLPPLVIGAALALVPGGAEWVRMLMYAGPFFAIALVQTIARLGAKRIIIVGFLLLFLLLPTMVAYYPAVGTEGATYPYQFAAGNYLNGYAQPVNVYIGYGVATLNYALLTRLGPGSTYNAYTVTGLVQYVQSQVEEFKASQSSLLSLDGLFYLHLAYIYGNATLSGEVSKIIGSAVRSSSLVYSNGFTLTYYN